MSFFVLTAVVEADPSTGLAAIQNGVRLRGMGRYNDARPEFERALLEFRLAGDWSNVARALNNLGSVAQGIGDRDQAERLYRQAMELDPKGEGGIVAVTNLTALFDERGEFRRSLELLNAWVSRPETAPFEARFAGQLGVIHKRLGNYADSEKWLRRTVELRRAEIRQGNQDARELAAALSNLGSLYNTMGRREEALEALAESVKLCACPSGLNNLGSVEQAMGRVAEAEAHFLEAVRRSTINTAKAAAHNNLGHLYARQNRRDEARTAYEAALKDWEADGYQAHPDYASTLTNIAVLALERGKKKEAYALMRRALDIDLAALGQDNLKVAADRSTLAAAAAGMKRYAEAVELLQASVDARVRLAPKTAETAMTIASLGESLALRKQWAASAAEFERAIAMWDAQPGFAPPNQLPILERYAEALRSIQEFGRAELVAARAMKVRVKQALRTTPPNAGASGFVEQY